MAIKLIVECGDDDIEFFDFDFNKAIQKLEQEYGYQGTGWEMIVNSKNMKLLYDFLVEDGLWADIKIEAI